MRQTSIPIKKLSILTFGLGFALALSAAPLTPEAALARIGTADKTAPKAALASPRLAYTSTADDGEAVAYVFASRGDGFAIVSADSRALPLLGYSDSGSFDPDNIPDGLRWLLESYADQLDQADRMGLPEFAGGFTFDKPAIEPLVKTKWDQLAPYYDQTPVSGGYHCPTGCVATSLAQAMNYFKYPETGTGRISYRWNGKSMILRFDREKFDWDNMALTYEEGQYTPEQAEAVSYLMKAAGYSVQMDYSADQSGAYSERIIEAVTKYFKYDPATYYATRNYYSQTEWYNMIYNNLRDCGPVIYNGTSPLAGGHSFICDGYDGNGYFHINWGWSGLSDGYYSLDILGPGVQGTGGSIGNFSFSQDAVLGMKPSADTTPLPKYTNLQQCGASVGTILDGNVLSLRTTDGTVKGWYNPTATENISVDFGVSIAPIDGSGSRLVPATIKSLEDDSLIEGGITINPGYYLSSDKYALIAELPALADGDYRVTLMTRDQNAEDAPWQPILIPYGYANYVFVTADGGNFEVRNVAPAIFRVKDVKLQSALYRGKNVKFSMTLENPTDLESTICVSPCLVRDEKVMYKASSRLITVEPHETLDYEWITSFYQLRGADDFFSGQEFTLELLDQDTGLMLGGTEEEIPMKPTPDNLLLVMDKLTVEGAESKTVEINGTEYRRVYWIPDFRDFTVDYEFTVRKGYFDTTMTLGIYERDTQTGELTLIRELYRDSEFLEQGTTQKVAVPVNFPEADTDRLYVIRGEYLYESVKLLVGQIQLAFATSGLDNIEDSETAPAEYYTLQGIRIDAPAPGQLVIERRGGKTAKRIFR